MGAYVHGWVMFMGRRVLAFLGVVWCCVSVVYGAEVEASKRPIKVACVGDSITFGLTLEDRLTQAYPAQLQRLLGEGYEVRNFGNSGRGVYLHTWRGLERRGFWYTKEHRAALEWMPDVVVCNLGINDCGEFSRYEVTHPGAWMQDYCTLLEDYARLPSKPKIYIWGKLAPLREGQAFYRSPDPFLMQGEIERVAIVTGATLIDMLEPLREGVDFLFPDQLHPNAEGARIIAETTHRALKREEMQPVFALPEGLGKDAELWLCVGGEGLMWPLGRCPEAAAEVAALGGHLVYVWDALSQGWTRVTVENMQSLSAMAVSFAVRRAKASGRPVGMLLVGASGAPAEAFLNEQTMAAQTRKGSALYPNLLQIVTDRRQMDMNASFPMTWCKQEYRRRLAEDGRWWGLGVMYKRGLMPVRVLKVKGVLYAPEETCFTLGEEGAVKVDEDYVRETLAAVVDVLQSPSTPPLVMVGTQKEGAVGEAYRRLQKAVCKEKGVAYLDLKEPSQAEEVTRVVIAERLFQRFQKYLKED